MLALAEVVSSGLPSGIRSVAKELLKNSLPAMKELRSLRAQAYLIQAWSVLRSAEVTDLDQLVSIAKSSAVRIADCYRHWQRTDWVWFEEKLTYANAVLPHALFDADACWPDEGFQSIAEATFSFLNSNTLAGGVFWPVGNENWFSRGEEKSPFDQQPLEASTMVACALAGFQCLGGDTRYREVASRARDWFAGLNSLNRSLVDVEAGACCDGLESSGLNLNQGAESTLAYLWTELMWSQHEASACGQAEMAMQLR